MKKPKFTAYIEIKIYYDQDLEAKSLEEAKEELEDTLTGEDNISKVVIVNNETKEEHKIEV